MALSRRVLVVRLPILLVLVPRHALAQNARVRHIGVLWPYSPPVSAVLGTAFRQGLRALGYVEGRDVVLQERWAHGTLDRLAALASELVQEKVDVIVTASTPAAQAAQQATRTLPIVMTLVTDPVDSGIVTSLARPGGNVTGLSLMHPEQSGKRLELLKDARSKLTKVGVLWSASSSSSAAVLRETETAARSLGLQLQTVEVRDATNLDHAFSIVAKARVGALLVLPDAMFRNEQKRLFDLAVRHRLPAMYWSREMVEAGGLMSYGASLPEIYRQAAAIVDKILKGAKPAELPIEQPAKLEFVINQKTARAIGFEIPRALALRADHIID